MLMDALRRGEKLKLGGAPESFEEKKPRKLFPCPRPREEKPPESAVEAEAAAKQTIAALRRSDTNRLPAAAALKTAKELKEEIRQFSGKALLRLWAGKRTCGIEEIWLWNCNPA